MSPEVNSTPWVIEQPHLKCYIVALDSELGIARATHLLSCKSLPVHCNIYATNAQQAQCMDNSVPIARSFTSLKSVFVCSMVLSVVHNSVTQYVFHPHHATYYKHSEVAFQLHVGTKLFAGYRIQSLAESYSSLRKRWVLPARAQAVPKPAEGSSWPTYSLLLRTARTRWVLLML